MEEKVEKGYWAVATQKHLNKFQTNTPNYEEFDALNNSGKAGRLLGLIRGNTRIENMKKLEKLAGTMGIGKRELKNTILPELEIVTEKKLELRRDSLNEIIGIEEYFWRMKKYCPLQAIILNIWNQRILKELQYRHWQVLNGYLHLAQSYIQN